MLASLTAFATSKVAAYAGLGVAGAAAAFALKKIPNDVLKVKFGLICYKAGIVCTLGLAKFKYTKGIWNKVIEPWVVDAIDNIIVNGIGEFVRGLRSDNA